MQYGQTLDEFIAEEIAEDASFAEKLRIAEEEVTFAVELARLREARGFTQKSLAEAARRKQPMLARIERGQIPTVPTLARLAQALGAEFTIRPEGGLWIKRRKAWKHPDKGTVIRPSVMRGKKTPAGERPVRSSESQPEAAVSTAAE